MKRLYKTNRAYMTAFLAIYNSLSYQPPKIDHDDHEEKSEQQIYPVRY
jgi:hypothetical protein